MSLLLFWSLVVVIHRRLASEQFMNSTGHKQLRIFSLRVHKHINSTSLGVKTRGYLHLKNASLYLCINVSAHKNQTLVNHIPFPIPLPATSRAGRPQQCGSHYPEGRQLMQL